MPNGNIAQYTQENPDVNRLTLVCAIGLKIDEGDALTTPTTACANVPWSNVSSRVRYFAL